MGSGTLLQSLLRAEPIACIARNPQPITELYFTLHKEVHGNRMRVNEVQTLSIVCTFFLSERFVCTAADAVYLVVFF